MADELKLFSDSGEDPSVPEPVTLAEADDLISHGVERAISGEYVNTLMIPEDTEILVPNYVIDFRAVEKVHEHQIKALSSIITKNGDTNIYMCFKGNLILLGLANSTITDKVLACGIKSVFGGECRVYKDVQYGVPLKEVTEQDFASLRLEL